MSRCTCNNFLYIANTYVEHLFCGTLFSSKFRSIVYFSIKFNRNSNIFSIMFEVQSSKSCCCCCCCSCVRRISNITPLSKLFLSKRWQQRWKVILKNGIAWRYPFCLCNIHSSESFEIQFNICCTGSLCAFTLLHLNTSAHTHIFWIPPPFHTLTNQKHIPKKEKLFFFLCVYTT